MELKNSTPFILDRMVILDKQAAEHLVVILKATYMFDLKGKLTIAEKQEPVKAEDEFYGDPTNSSIKHEAELGPMKPATDVVLFGHACVPHKGIHTMDITFRVGPVAKTVRIFGERKWSRTLGIPGISSPLPFEMIPLIYENAFGGKDISAENPMEHGQESFNPVGRGFQTKKSRIEWVDTTLPNIEDPTTPITRPDQHVRPQGFGFIGRNWQPRLGFAGTYDQTWLDERLPLLPLDFDERFHNAAHPDLVAPGYLMGGEMVEVIGCTASGRVTFHLPKVFPACNVRFRNQRESLDLRLNTVAVDTEARQLRLLWKGDLWIHKRLLHLREINCRIEGET